MGPPRYNHPKVTLIPARHAAVRADSTPNAFVCIRSRIKNIDGLHKVALPKPRLRGLVYSVFTVKFYGQAERAISNGQLNVLLRLHIRPIDVVVFHGPS